MAVTKDEVVRPIRDAGLELSELVRELRTSLPLLSAAVAAAPTAAGGAAEEQRKTPLTLSSRASSDNTRSASSRLSVALTNLGLKRSKGVVEGALRHGPRAQKGD